jgi:flagellar motility protein MotE (MotC chaperone)
VIVTRQRKRRRGLGRFIVPALGLAGLAVALAWPPAHHVIADGPLAPVWNTGARGVAVVTRPLSFAAQQQVITDKNRTLRELDGRLETQRQAKAAAEARVAQLQHQIEVAAAEPAATPVPAPVRTAAPAGLDFAAAPAAQSAEGFKRLAATWAAMEPEKAAAVVQRLPDDQVTRVLALMDADAAAGILNALPPAVAARISRASTQVSAAPGR